MSQTEHSYQYFSNHDCKYFPCHKNANPEHFNCLFCYCPLYALGRNCGGNFKFTEKGIKDCSDCLLPHSPQGYNYINGKFKEIVAQVKRNEEQDD